MCALRVLKSLAIIDVNIDDSNQYNPLILKNSKLILIRENVMNWLKRSGYPSYYNWFEFKPGFYNCVRLKIALPNEKSLKNFYNIFPYSIGKYQKGFTVYVGIDVTDEMFSWVSENNIPVNIYRKYNCNYIFKNHQDAIVFKLMFM